MCAAECLQFLQAMSVRNRTRHYPMRRYGMPAPALSVLKSHSAVYANRLGMDLEVFVARMFLGPESKHREEKHRRRIFKLTKM